MALLPVLRVGARLCSRAVPVSGSGGGSGTGSEGFYGFEGGGLP